MIVTIRDRKLAEDAWDMAATKLQWDNEDDEAARYLYETNPYRADGTRYCTGCEEATVKNTMDQSLCGSCGRDYY